MEMIRAIDLCCGCGGWACAARGLPIEFIAVADQAADCLETWSWNHQESHPSCQILQCDLASKDGRCQILKAVGKVDVVLGAIPCEQLSCARANRPLKVGEIEAVHALIDSCFQIVKKLRPRWWCFEDVTQVEGHLPMPLFNQTNYRCLIINAADYGPQARTRLFFGSFPNPAPPEPGARVLADVLRPGPYRTLPGIADYELTRSKWYGGKKARVQCADKASAVVISSQGGCGSRAERSALVDQPPLARVEDAGQASPSVVTANSRHERAMLVAQLGRDPYARERVQDPTGPSRTVFCGHDGQALTNGQGPTQSPRIMEWQEAATLQGFPENYLFAASWSRTWKLVAQAIPIYVGRALLKAIAAEHQRTS